jgi:hypothetical protein
MSLAPRQMWWYKLDDACIEKYESFGFPLSQSQPTVQHLFQSEQMGHGILADGMLAQSQPTIQLLSQSDQMGYGILANGMSATLHKRFNRTRHLFLTQTVWPSSSHIDMLKIETLDTSSQFFHPSCTHLGLQRVLKWEFQDWMNHLFYQRKEQYLNCGPLV